jgi:hypothetical protein
VLRGRRELIRSIVLGIVGRMIHAGKGREGGIDGVVHTEWPVNVIVGAVG